MDMIPRDAALIAEANSLCKRLGEIGSQLKESARQYNDHVPLIHFFYGVGTVYDTLSDYKKSFNDVYDNLSRDTVPEALREQGVKSVTLDFGALGKKRATISQRYSCSIVDKAKGFQWLRDNDYGALITETVNSSTLSGFAKDLIVEQNRELPPDIFKVSTSSFTSITAAK